MSTTNSPPPKSILILGAGVFGLSTALTLSTSPTYSSTTITVLEKSPIIPSPHASSTDTSRIIRTDYSHPLYSRLGARSLEKWRLDPSSSSSLGGAGRYTESGLILVANHKTPGMEYVKKSWENVQKICRENNDPDGAEELDGREKIRAAFGTGGVTGDWGYINRRSGWADAGRCMEWLYEKVKATGRINFVTGEAVCLLREPSASSQVVTGVLLASGETIKAERTILATGAWSPLLLDMRHIATSTAQALAYTPISPAQQKELGNIPVLLNLSTGLFVIPPRNNELKVARHAYGYMNPVRITNPESTSSTSPSTQSSQQEKVVVSKPTPDLPIPASSSKPLAEFLQQIVPEMKGFDESKFSHTRLCHYTDTPTGDFLITYHPSYAQNSLFIATGGSGHAFKFLPVLGDCVVEGMEGKLSKEYKELWKWPSVETQKKGEEGKGGEEGLVWTDDGSRGGEKGWVLDIGEEEKERVGRESKL